MSSSLLSSEQIILNKYKKKHSYKKTKYLDILDIPHEILRDEITSYLTIYENFQLLFVFKNIDINWVYLQNRDFPLSSYEKCKFNAIHLDNGNFFTNTNTYNLITKTDSMNNFKLSTKDMEKIEPDAVTINPRGFRIPMKLYNIKKILNLCASKHFGITNFKLKQSISRKKKEHRDSLKLQEIQKFEKWRLDKDKENKNHYKNMTSQQRKFLLDQEFHNCEFDITRRSDSHLCNKFISGQILTKSVEEIVCIMIVTKILFNNGGYNYYISKHDKLDNDLQKLKFNNPELSWYDCIYRIKF